MGKEKGVGEESGAVVATKAKPKNKHAPTEVSSKKPVPRLRPVLLPPAGGAGGGGGAASRRRKARGALIMGVGWVVGCGWCGFCLFDPPRP